MNHDVVGGRASALGNLLSCQVEIVMIFLRNLIEHAGAGGRVKDFGQKFTLRRASLARVKNSCINLLVDSDVDHLRMVVSLLRLLSDFLNYTREGIDLRFQLYLNLMNTQALTIDHDDIRSFFVLLNIILGPIEENSVEISLGDVFLSLIASLTEIKYLRIFCIESTYKGKGKPSLSLRN